MHRSLQGFTIPQVNPFIYGGFSFIVVILAVLTIVNFFVSDYASILEHVNFLTLGLSSLAILIIGNVARMVILSRLIRG